MSSQEIWLTHYRLTPLNNACASYTGYILALAEDQANFYHQAERFCVENEINSYAQLAALPILTWFQRHGFSAELLRVAQTLSPRNPDRKSVV